VPRSPLSLARAPTGPAYDNAWLDRIHLLNGGQNMPTFVPALQESSAEMGIGAGLQPAPVVSMPPSLPSTAEEPSATGTPTSAEAHSVWRKANTSVNGAAGDDHQDEVALSASGVSSSVEAAETAAASVPSSAAPASSTVAESSARRRADSTSSGGAVKPAAPAATSKSKARRAQAAASVLADSESWPSPLDATVKTAARSKPRAESVSTGENSSSERPAATEKGLEGLDVQVAKGAGDKGKKGKQWISIVPTITHASPLPASGRKTSGKDAASKDASSATSPHPKKAAKTRADKGAAGGEKRPEADKQDAKSGTKESSKASRQDASAPSAAADSVLASGQGQAREAEASLSAPGAPPAEAADSSGAPDAVSASPALNGETDASAPVALPFSSPLMPMALSELPAMFPPMRWTSGSPGPPSPFPFVPPPPQRLNKDGSFSPTRATDFLVPNGDPSWHASHSPVRHSARGRGSRGRGRGGRHAGGDVFSGSRNDGAYMPCPGADGADLDSQGAPSSRGSPGSGSYATGAQLPFWLHGGQPHALPVFQPQGMAPASLAHGEWQQPPPTRAPAFVNSPAGSPRVPGIDAPTHQLLKQIEFYFSERNLQGDFFLRQCMDAHGWVSISTVAGFNRVQRLTSDLALVRDTLLYSSVLEVDASNMRVRKAQNWESYVLGANGVPNDVDQSSRPSSAQAGISEQHYSSLAQDDASRRHAGLAQLRRQDSAATEGSGVNGYTGESSNADGRSTTTVLTEASRSKSSTAFSSPPSSAAHQDSSMEDGCSDSDKEVSSAENSSGWLR
jgi:la-related protein 1